MLDRGTEKSKKREDFIMRVFCIILLTCFLATNVYTACGTDHSYPNARPVSAPQWYTEFFANNGISGEYLSSADGLSTVSDWYKQNGQYTILKQDNRMCILLHDNEGVAIMDKQVQLDEEFRDKFENTMILKVTGPAASVKKYLKQF